MPPSLQNTAALTATESHAPQLKAAVLTVGDELTCGYRLDTNSQEISRRLALLSLDVALHLSVNDTLDEIHAGLRVVLEAADVVVVTGGLGPTEDDLTRQAVAAHFSLELVEDARVLERIRERFARREREMPESNRIQAHIPAGGEVIPNERGTAAGFYLPTQDEQKHLFATPGIPYEMEGMLEQFILPRLQEIVGDGRHVRRAAVKLYGLPESEINERIRPLLARGRNPLLGLLPHRGTITVEVVAAGETAEEAQALLEADLAALRSEFGHVIISEDERELPRVVADLLLARELTVSVAEVGTGGLVAARLTAPGGNARWFRGGTVVSGGSSSDGEALAQALAARQATAADVGVGVGPVVVPEDVPPDRPYGLVHVAVSVRGKETCRRLGFNGDRARVREWAADGALALVRLCVLREEDQRRDAEAQPGQ